MTKWISILSGLLVAQLAFALVVNLTGEDYGAFKAQEKMLALDTTAVDGLRIENNDSNVLLKKREGKWLLPESGDFPASAGSVEGLLEKLAALDKGWPVATTAGAARRFKVADDEFDRKLTLLGGEETLAELYVGSSPGFRKIHVRPEGEKAVFSVVLDSYEMNAKADDWIDKEILKLDENDLERIEMPGLILQAKEGKLQVTDLEEKEQTNEQESRSLLGKLTGLRIQSLLGTEAKPEYGQDNPLLEVKVARKGSEVLDYRFSKPQDASYYVLKRSDLNYYFKLAEYTVDPLKEVTRDKLVQVKTEKASAEETSSAKPVEPAIEAVETAE